MVWALGGRVWKSQGKSKTNGNEGRSKMASPAEGVNVVSAGDRREM